MTEINNNAWGDKFKIGIEEAQLKDIKDILGGNLDISNNDFNGIVKWEVSLESKMSEEKKEALKNKGFIVYETILDYDGGKEYIYKIEKVNTSVISKLNKIIENNKEEIDKIKEKITEIKKKLVKIDEDGKVTKKEFLELQNLEKKLKLLKGKNEAQEEIITEIKNTLIKLKEKYTQEKTKTSENILTNIEEKEQEKQTLEKKIETPKEIQTFLEKENEIMGRYKEIVNYVYSLSANDLEKKSEEELKEIKNELREKQKELEEIKNDFKENGKQLIKYLESDEFKEFIKNSIDDFDEKFFERQKKLFIKEIKIREFGIDVVKDYIDIEINFINNIKYKNNNDKHLKYLNWKILFEEELRENGKVILGDVYRLKGIFYFDLKNIQNLFSKKYLDKLNKYKQEKSKEKTSEEKTKTSENILTNIEEKEQEKVEKKYKEEKEEVEEYFVEINGKKILTDADGNPLENQETKNLEKSEQKINKAEAEKITENLEKATKQIETGNLTNPEASEEDVKQLKEYIEKSPLSDSALEKFLKAIEKFFGLLSGIKIDAYLDKDKGLILRDKLSEFDEKIFNEKYKQDFENILKNSEIKKAWVIKTEKSKLKGKDVEEDFALMVDVNGPNNMFVNKIDGENYSDKNSKIEIFYEAEGNFERKEIKVSELKNEMKNFNKKYSSILEFAQKINKQDGKVSIEDYKKVEKSGYKDYEKKEYLKGVESGLIADVKETKDGVKFLLLGEKDYVGKDEMLQKVKQINEKPKSFWRSYLNTLGIRLETKVRNPSMEKILVDLPGEKDLIYIDNGKEKRIYEARNGKAIDGNIIGISGIEVAGLYTDQIIILAHALKNNIDLRNIGEFKYDQIRNIFSKNKNLKDLKIFKPKGPEAIVALEKPFEEEKMRYKDFLVIQEREENSSSNKENNPPLTPPSNQGGEKKNINENNKEKTTGKTTTTNVHKEQANQVFGNNDEEDF